MSHGMENTLWHVISPSLRCGRKSNWWTSGYVFGKWVFFSRRIYKWPTTGKVFFCSVICLQTDHRFARLRFPRDRVQIKSNGVVHGIVNRNCLQAVIVGEQVFSQLIQHSHTRGTWKAIRAAIFLSTTLAKLIYWQGHSEFHTRRNDNKEWKIVWSTLFKRIF